MCRFRYSEDDSPEKGGVDGNLEITVAEVVYLPNYPDMGDRHSNGRIEPTGPAKGQTGNPG